MSDDSASPDTCPQCGTSLPFSATEGLCPHCLMNAAMHPTQPDDHGKAPRSPILTPDEIACHFPQHEILRLIGHGGMGAVYLARQLSLDRFAAIKLLSADLGESDPTFIERFKNEARTMARLSHPGLVAVYDFGETANGLLYIVMEYVEGTDVQMMLNAQGRLHSAHAMAITAHVCDALHYAHARGIIHRDIKPSNIMVSQEGVVKVADFGLAKMSQSAAGGALTQSGLAMGTPHFIAPEALTLGSEVDLRADVYAIGVMLYQMLTGALPQGLFEMPSFQVPGLDPRYDSIVGKALRTDRSLRYQDTVAMRKDLDAILTQPVQQTVPIGPAKPSVPTQPPRPQQRPPAAPGRPMQRSKTGRTKSALLMGVAIMVVAVIAADYFFNNPDALPSSPGGATAQQTPASSLTPRILISPEYEWSKPENLGPTVNSPGTEKDLSISANELVMIFQTTRNGRTGLFESIRRSKSEPFGEPKPVEGLEGGPSETFLTADGLGMVYQAFDGPGRQGNTDLYEVHRSSPGAKWGAPVSLGNAVNTPDYDSGPWLSADGCDLLLYSNRPGDLGGNDIWRSHRPSPSSAFSAPVHLGSEVNSRAGEYSPFGTSDPQMILFCRGENNRVSTCATVQNASGEWAVQSLDLPVEARFPHLVADPTVLYFTADCAGGFGGQDIWKIRRVPKSSKQL